MHECDKYLNKLVRIRRLKDVLCEYPSDSDPKVRYDSPSFHVDFFAPRIPFGFNVKMLPYFGNVFRTRKRYPATISTNHTEEDIGFYADNNHYLWGLNLIEEVVAE